MLWTIEFFAATMSLGCDDKKIAPSDLQLFILGSIFPPAFNRHDKRL